MALWCRWSAHEFENLKVTGRYRGEPLDLIRRGSYNTPIMGYSNGKYPQSALVKVQDAGNGYKTEYLRGDAADNFLAAKAAAKRAGVTIYLNDGYRSYSEQVYLAEKYGLYSQGGLAAQPGTSNHGHGFAVDVDDVAGGRAWMDSHGDEYGYYETVPRESWHFDCTRTEMKFQIQTCPFSTLRHGSVDADVRLLAARFGVSISKSFGSRLDEKVRYFQRTHGLKADGVVGPATWLKVLRGSYRLPELRRGSGKKGTRAALFVLILKRRLRSLGYRGFFMNNTVYGTGTERAVKKFQRERGLPVDGTVGPKTWRRLFW
jgi:peptidoglycan hydrolase-like protein with peptidoglycan-binding domain